MTDKEEDFLCSAGFVCLGTARLYFQSVYEQLLKDCDAEASKRADYRALKKVSPVKAHAFMQEVRKQLFTPDQRQRYKAMMQHIDLLMKDFEWVESYALLGHLNKKLDAVTFCDLFDAYLESSNDLARLILLWSDWQDNHKGDTIQVESWFKNGTQRETGGHLADLYRPVIHKTEDKE